MKTVQDLIKDVIKAEGGYVNLNFSMALFISMPLYEIKE